MSLQERLALLETSDQLRVGPPSEQNGTTSYAITNGRASLKTLATLASEGAFLGTSGGMLRVSGGGGARSPSNKKKRKHSLDDAASDDDAERQRTRIEKLIQTDFEEAFKPKLRALLASLLDLRSSDGQPAVESIAIQKKSSATACVGLRVAPVVAISIKELCRHLSIDGLDTSDGVATVESPASVCDMDLPLTSAAEFIVKHSDERALTICVSVKEAQV